jgi:hypothetical protein
LCEDKSFWFLFANCLLELKYFKQALNAFQDYYDLVEKPVKASDVEEMVNALGQMAVCCRKEGTFQIVISL